MHNNFEIEITEKLQKLIKVHADGSQYKNNLNVEAFNKYLRSSNDPNINIRFIEDGFPLYLKTDNTPYKPIDLSQQISNFIKDERDLCKIIDTFIEECENGDIVPAYDNASYVINVFTVPKKDSETGLMTKLRVVRHGSFKTLNTTSINDWIRRDKCKMPTLPNLKKYVNLLIKHNYASLRDLKNAFRQINLASADQHYLGYSIFGLKFMERKQAYGISSAAANCQSFAQILIWILNNHKLPIQLRNNILVHIDDFVLAATDTKSAKFMAKCFDDLCRELNVKISTNKNVDVQQRFELYGFFFDLELKTVSIPDEKHRKLTKFIEQAIKFRWMTRRAIETLCGQIMHWSQLRGASKALLINTVTFLHKQVKTLPGYKKKWFRLTTMIVKDLKFWLSYSQLLKTVPMEDIIKAPSYQIIGSSDACDIGGGFVVGTHWSYYKFIDRHINRWEIAQKEAHAVLMIINNLKHWLTGKKLILLIDNQTLFWAMKRHWASGMMMPFIYELSLLQMKYKIWIWFEWIPTQYNILSDALSRGNLNSFWHAVELHNYKVDKKPLRLKYVFDFEMYCH